MYFASTLFIDVYLKYFLINPYRISRNDTLKKFLKKRTPLRMVEPRPHGWSKTYFEKIQKKQCRIRTVTAPNFSQIGQKLRSGIAKSFPHPTIYLLPEFEVNWPKNDRVIE